MKSASPIPHRLGLTLVALLAGTPLLARQPMQNSYAPAADPAWRGDGQRYDGGTYDIAEVLRSEPQTRIVRIVEPQQECHREVRYVHSVERYEERVDGYRVTYRYNGHIFSTQLPRDPGGTLRVRVNVEPVG